MENFFDIVLNVLKQDERFFAEDGTFLRNAVYEAAMQMDENLIRLLISNEDTKSRFFKEVDDILVFDKVGFAWVINNREFLPDSYTRFKNKIGLADEYGKMISTIMGPLSRPRSKILRVAVSRIILSSEASKVKLVGNLVA